MDLKNQSFRILNVSDNVPAPRTKLKDRARKELWDSLLAIYENEAEKENVGEIEEVEVIELEKYTEKNRDTSPRAQTQLAQTNPELLTAAAFSESAGLILKLEIEEEPNNKGKKRKRDQESARHCKYKSSCDRKPEKGVFPTKKCVKWRQGPKQENLRTSLLRSSVEKKKIKYLNKLHSTQLNEDKTGMCEEKGNIVKQIKKAESGKAAAKDENVPRKLTIHNNIEGGKVKYLKKLQCSQLNKDESKMCLGKKSRTQQINVAQPGKTTTDKNSAINLISHTSVEGEKARYLKKLQGSPLNGDKLNLSLEKRKRTYQLNVAETDKTSVDKNVNKQTIKYNVEVLAKKEKQVKHNCELEYRYYLDGENECVRSDNRVFSCKLIFKVCLCSKSNIVL